MFKQVSDSCEPKIIGVNNGTFQIEIDEEFLQKHGNYDLVRTLFWETDIFKFMEKQEEIFNIDLRGLKGILLPKAKVTDFMGFSPYMFGINYIVSERIKSVLDELKVSKREYKLFPIELENISDSFCLLFIPVIHTKEIIFPYSIVRLKNYLTREKKFFPEIESYNDYQEMLDKMPFLNFDSICLPFKYSAYNLLNIQPTHSLYFSEKLIDSLNSIKASNFLIPQTQIKLTFKE